MGTAERKAGSLVIVIECASARDMCKIGSCGPRKNQLFEFGCQGMPAARSGGEYMFGRVSPLQVVALLGLASLGLFAPPDHRVQAVVGIFISASLLLKFYQYAVGSKRNDRAELTHRFKLAPKLILFRLLFFFSLYAVLLAIIVVLQIELPLFGILLAAVAVLFWVGSRIYARKFLGGASSWSLIIGTAPIFRPPKVGAGENSIAGSSDRN